MRTDSLFYALFQSFPALLFELIGESSIASAGYRFDSIELKQTAFRIDGVFLPPESEANAPVYFLEAQFQRDAQLYRRLFAEVFLYLRQHPDVRQWCCIRMPRSRWQNPKPLVHWSIRAMFRSFT